MMAFTEACQIKGCSPSCIASGVSIIKVFFINRLQKKYVDVQDVYRLILSTMEQCKGKSQGITSFASKSKAHAWKL